MIFFERSPKSSLYSFYSGSVSSTLNPNDDDGEHFLYYFTPSPVCSFFEDMMNQPIQFCFRKRAQAPCGQPIYQTLNPDLPSYCFVRLQANLLLVDVLIYPISSVLLLLSYLRFVEGGCQNSRFSDRTKISSSTR